MGGDSLVVALSMSSEYDLFAGFESHLELRIDLRRLKEASGQVTGRAVQIMRIKSPFSDIVYIPVPGPSRQRETHLKRLHRGLGLRR